MATDPNWDPVDEELAELLKDDPDLVAELAEFDRAYKAGEADLIPDEEVPPARGAWHPAGSSIH